MESSSSGTHQGWGSEDQRIHVFWYQIGANHDGLNSVLLISLLMSNFNLKIITVAVVKDLKDPNNKL